MYKKEEFEERITNGETSVVLAVDMSAQPTPRAHPVDNA